MCNLSKNPSKMCSNLKAKLVKERKFGAENYCNLFDKRSHMQFCYP